MSIKWQYSCTWSLGQENRWQTSLHPLIKSYAQYMQPEWSRSWGKGSVHKLKRIDSAYFKRFHDTESAVLRDLEAELSSRQNISKRAHESDDTVLRRLLSSQYSDSNRLYLTSCEWHFVLKWSYMLSYSWYCWSAAKFHLKVITKLSRFECHMSPITN